MMPAPVLTTFATPPSTLVIDKSACDNKTIPAENKMAKNKAISISHHEITKAEEYAIPKKTAGIIIPNINAIKLGIVPYEKNDIQITERIGRTINITLSQFIFLDSTMNI